MGTSEEPTNDTPELRDALRSIQATHEDETGLAVEPAPPATPAADTTWTDDDAGSDNPDDTTRTNDAS